MNRQIEANDRGFLYGDGLFETVRLKSGHANFLDRHQSRFERSARWMGYPDHMIDKGLAALDSLQGRRDGLWRVTVTRPDPRASGSTGTVQCQWRADPYSDDEGPGPKVAIVENFYFPQFRLAEHKTTSWLRSLEAKRRAMARGFDEALMVSPRGRIGEAAAANIFLKIGDQWVTPCPQGILPGIIREVLIENAHRTGIDIVSRPVAVGDLQTCEALVLTSTGRMVTAASAVEDQSLNEAPARELKQVLEKYLRSEIEG